MAWLRICGAILGLLGAAGAAFAEDAPLLRPSRDVAVTYKAVGRGGDRVIRISQRAQASVMRIDTDGQPGYLLVDRQSQRASAVMEAQGYYIDMPANRVPQQGQFPDDKISFSRGKDDVVAGAGCTNWDYVTARGNGTVCVTADGVMLRVLALSGTGLEATEVSYAPIPPGRFVPPAGIRKLGASSSVAAHPPAAPAFAPASVPNSSAPASSGAVTTLPPATASGAGAAGGTTLPGGITLPPGVNLPPGLKIPPNLKLPPGFKLPPGIQLPPGVSLPSQ